jgi:beta-lactamase superfamily II metal-dependent hydrolase
MTGASLSIQKGKNVNVNLRGRIMRRLFTIPVLHIAVAAGICTAQTTGQTLPPWSPGVLDIHYINTGKGDSSFFILPDGTTLLVDAGHTLRPPPRVTPQRPDDSRTPGEWIARYIRRMLPDRSGPIDYALLTHFHGDHMGEIGPETKTSASGQYKLAAIAEVAESVGFRKVLDRGWPDYDYPAPLENDMVRNYRALLKWQAANKGLRGERFRPGRNDQVALVHSHGRYTEFEIRNIAANGEIWTGTGQGAKQHFPALTDVPKNDWPEENMCSIAFRLRYGKFDYFNGGDMPGLPAEGSPSWHDVETPVAKVVGAVDVHDLNHHGFHDAANAFFLGRLQPRVHILSVYAPSHPGHRVLNRLLSTRLYPGPRDIFATNLMDATRVVIDETLNALKSAQGHIVIRVEPGGSAYRVIILEDSAETYRITAVHGPYQSR